jgi:mannitol/fructose-specific phosphotransferase system IIA component (Ntr-type)
MLPKRLSSVISGSLADYTAPGLIIPELRERDTLGVVKELSTALHQQGCVPDLLAFYHAALNHEFLINSSTESGVVFPHARLNGVVEPRFAFGKSLQPLVWGNRSAHRVEFVFLLAVPATEAAGFLRLLSALARLGQEPPLLDSLRERLSVKAIYELFKQIAVINR